jgi:hypothetical protein
MPGGRPERTCTSCGRTTTSKSGICGGCPDFTRYGHTVSGPEHALVGGTWRPSRGIQRWQPWQPDLERSA